MRGVHRDLDGSWDTCADAACALRFHLTDLTQAECERMPLEMLLPLLNVIDPHDEVRDGDLWWTQQPPEPSFFHRDYDLPAVVRRDGTLEWWQHGLQHRAGDNPAIIHPDGTREWMRGGKHHRSRGPAVIRPNGKLEFWIGGVLSQRENLLAWQAWTA